MIGTLFDTLEATGQSENSAIIFTSDHGEMLGERGMWFKKHFFEASLRVPLLMKISGVAPARITRPASLVDQLPTFMGIAEGTGWTSDIEPLDGIDLTTLIENEQPDRAVFAEYLAEATTAPIFMIRRGRYKFVSSADDPPLLFDLTTDSHEHPNLATDPAQADRVDQFLSEVSQRWDAKKLADDIRLSQQRRWLILKGYDHRTKPRWNHGEVASSDVIWYRG